MFHISGILASYVEYVLLWPRNNISSSLDLDRAVKCCIFNTELCKMLLKCKLSFTLFSVSVVVMVAYM